MTNNQTHLDKNNFDNIFLRNVILGFRGFLHDRFKWTNVSEDGPYEVKIPIFYSMLGDTRYVMDAFYDDIPDKRVNMNTDQIPRGVITLNSWAVKMDEFTNPNTWLNVNVMNDDDELQQIVTQTKGVPVKLSFTLDTIFDNEIDVFKMWQTYMDNMWIYKYFVFDFKRIPINAVFNFTADTQQTKVREASFGDVDLLKISFEFEIHTFYPIFDYNNKFNANDTSNFIIDIWQNNQNTNLNPSSGE
jgi:hypothetical protein